MVWRRSSGMFTFSGVHVLLCLIAVLGVSHGLSNIYSSGCTGQRLQLSCPQYHKIAIKRVLYGVKRNWDCALQKNGSRGASDANRFLSTSDCCRNSHVDCHIDGDSMYPTLNTKCSGYQSCELEVQKVPTREPCRFKSYSDYMTIVYDCVSVGDIATFCSDDVKRGKSLYLANREYPGSIRPRPGGDECQCIIQTPHAQGISIHTIDVLLAWADMGPMECKRSLKIQDPQTYQKDIQCAHRGYYGFKSIYSRTVSNVTVTLSSLPGDGMAFVWLQVKPNDADSTVEVICGQPLQDILNRLRHQSQSRQRETTPYDEKEESKEDKKVEDNVEKKSNITNVTVRAGSHQMNSDLAAIVGGIVAAGFILIAMVIVAMALHCRRVREEKRQTKPLELYPAVNSEPLDLSSYCRYDYDEDHLCSISRSPMKMATLADEGSVANSFKPNGFTTIVHAEESHIRRDMTPSPPLPPGISTPPPSAQNQPLLAGRSYREVHYPGDMSLRFVKPLMNNGSDMTAPTVDVTSYDYQDHTGHTTLPSHRKTVLISCGPKSPLGKRSKSVTFSQPVAMVTPLNSESEESVEKSEVNGDGEDPSYDNLNKLDIPDYPLMPGKVELTKFPRWNDDYNDDNPHHQLLPGKAELIENCKWDNGTNGDSSDYHHTQGKAQLMGNFEWDNDTPRENLEYPLLQGKTELIEDCRWNNDTMGDNSNYPLMAGKAELIKIPRWDQNYAESVPTRPLSTFQNSPSTSPTADTKTFVSPPFDLKLTSDSNDTCHMSNSSSFWSPTKQHGKPLVMPKPQKAEMYETGV